MVFQRNVTINPTNISFNSLGNNTQVSVNNDRIISTLSSNDHENDADDNSASKQCRRGNILRNSNIIYPILILSIFVIGTVLISYSLHIITMIKKNNSEKYKFIPDRMERTMRNEDLLPQTKTTLFSYHSKIPEYIDYVYRKSLIPYNQTDKRFLYLLDADDFILKTKENMPMLMSSSSFTSSSLSSLTTLKNEEDKNQQQPQNLDIIDDKESSSIVHERHESYLREKSEYIKNKIIHNYPFFFSFEELIRNWDIEDTSIGTFT